MKGKKVSGVALASPRRRSSRRPRRPCPTRAGEPFRPARLRRCGSSGPSTGMTRVSLSGSAAPEQLWRWGRLWRCADTGSHRRMWPARPPGSRKGVCRLDT
jgi:hypothetical protein